MNSHLFNPAIPSVPPPPREINWTLLAQRWAAEHSEPPSNYIRYKNPPPSSGNYFNNPAGTLAHSHHRPSPSQYGSFFASPPIHNRPPPLLHQAYPQFSPPIGLNQLPLIQPVQTIQPPMPLPGYGNPYEFSPYETNLCESSSWRNTPKPLFPSHAQEHLKSSDRNNYDPTDDNEVPIGAMPHWLNEVNVDDPAIVNWMNMGDWSAYDPNAVIDQQTRKKLPAWLLEGLEKAEKEKKQKEERNLEKKQMEEKELERERRRREKGLGKFDTDSENSEDESTQTSSSKPKPVFVSDSQVARKRKFSEISEQDIKDNQMASIRRLVTSVLLEASDNVIGELSHRFMNKARAEAKPKLIAKSSGLSALSSIVGYSDDESSAEEG